MFKCPMNESAAATAASTGFHTISWTTLNLDRKEDGGYCRFESPFWISQEH